MSSELALREEAFKKVDLAGAWILELATESKYEDEYTAWLGRSDKEGVMPVAETLMCLANLREYEHVALSARPSDELVARTAKELLRRYKLNGFDGMPYLQAPKGMTVPFTDAACFTAGAMTSVLALGLVKKELKTECVSMLIECAQWLVSAQAETPPVTGLAGRGWSWASPSVIDADKSLSGMFGRKLPAQTYFTSSAFITLSEILFEHYDELERRGMTEVVFQSITDGKSFLLSTLFEEANNTGWADFGGPLGDDRTKLEGLGDMPIFALDQDRSSGYICPIGEFTLYGLEAMSYVRYYGRQPKYTSVIQKLKTNYPQLFERFITFSEDSIRKLDKSFSYTLYLLRIQEIAKKTCRIQVPKPLNSRDQDRYAFYLDGTVGYNMLNVLNFYTRSFTEAASSLEDWKQQEFRHVEQLLRQSFTESSFAHCGNPSNNEVFAPAIYATRTAVAAFLSWGVTPPAAVAEVPADVRETVSALYRMVVGQEKSGESDLGEEEVRKLLRLGYVVGLAVHRLSQFDKLPSWQKLIALDGATVAEKDTIIRENGPKLLSFIGDVLTSDSTTAGATVDKLIAQRGIAVPFRTFFERNRSSISDGDMRSRLNAMSEVSGAVRTAVVEAGDTRFGELCDAN